MNSDCDMGSQAPKPVSEDRDQVSMSPVSDLGPRSRRVKLTVAYDGTAYSGWQTQPNAVTIQSVMEEALFRLTQEPVKLRASGRTDAGVHAREQVLDFCDSGKRDIETIIRGGNAFLPEDIRILSAQEAPMEFNARRDAREKEYRYFLLLSRAASPFLSRYSWRIDQPVDLDAVREALSHLVGVHDFASFQGQGCTAQTSVRTIFRADVTLHDATGLFLPGLCSINIVGSGFLRHMVRNIVGTVIDAGLGKYPPGHIAEILEKRQRTEAGIKAPARGLFLWEVKY